MLLFPQLSLLVAIHLFICGSRSRHQHHLPHIRFPFLEAPVHSLPVYIKTYAEVYLATHLNILYIFPVSVSEGRLLSIHQQPAWL